MKEFWCINLDFESPANLYIVIGMMMMMMITSNTKSAHLKNAVSDLTKRGQQYNKQYLIWLDWLEIRGYKNKLSATSLIGIDWVHPRHHQFYCSYFFWWGVHEKNLTFMPNVWVFWPINEGKDSTIQTLIMLVMPSHSEIKLLINAIYTSFVNIKPDGLKRSQ